MNDNKSSSEMRTMMFLFGYKGNRELFNNYEAALKSECAEITGILIFQKVFETLKNVLDNVHGVTIDRY